MTTNCVGVLGVVRNRGFRRANIIWTALVGVMLARPAVAVEPGLVIAPQRLQRLDAFMEGYVDRRQLAGSSILVAQHGRTVYAKNYGYRDLASKAPMTADTIVRLYSMTKPVTGVAMMILYEEGKWSLSDPVTMYIPEFAQLKVYAGADAKGEPRLTPAARPPTLGELMSHTAGFAYGISGSPVDKMYQKLEPLSAPSLKEMIQRLAQLPLAYQPGTQWQYSVSVDIQGYLVEKLSGQSLPEFMRSRIFEPLGMKDTGFAVPVGKHGRVATLYAVDKSDGALQPVPHPALLDPDIAKVPGLASGGGGLYSTANDYLKFAQMLANGGELNGHRILAPRTVALMRTNRMSSELLAGGFGIGPFQLRPGNGFGLDVAVFDDPYRAGSVIGKGSYYWDGAAGTWFWVDPENDIVFIGMIQRFVDPGMPPVVDLSTNVLYQALVPPDPSAK